MTQGDFGVLDALLDLLANRLADRLTRRGVTAGPELIAAASGNAFAPVDPPPAPRAAPVLQIVPRPRGGSEILTLKEVAKLLQVSQPTARKVMREDGLPYISVGKQFRFRRREVERWIAGRKANGSRRA